MYLSEFYTMVIYHRRMSLEIIRFAIFFVLYYLYVWLRIDPSLIYHGYGMLPFPFFYQGWEFFKEFLGYPGGIIEYISTLFYQFYYFSYLGSLIITVVAILICILTGKFIASIGNNRFRVVIYIPAILLLMVYNKYYHCLTISLGLLASLCFLWIYLLIAQRKAILRLSVFLISSIILYYIGGGSYLLYALLCGIFEFLNKQKRFTGLLYIFSGFFFPYIAGIYVFEVNITDAYMRISPFHPESYMKPLILALLLYIFFPLAAIWFSLWHPAVKKSLKPEADTIPSGKDIPDYSRISKRKFFYESLVLFAIGAVIILVPFDRNIKTALRINSFSCREMWNQVLKEARKIPIERYNILINHDVNKALYYTDRLLYDMFSYPQNPVALLNLGSSEWGRRKNIPILYAELPKISDTYFRIGLVNYAEHTAHLSMDLIGEHPTTLRQLIFIYLAKGNTQAARIYLNQLSKDLVFGRWAKKYLRQLDKDPLMSSDKLVQHARSVITTVDNVRAFTIDKYLLDLLHNKKNRMAFEYLMAYYLLTFDFEKIADNIHRLDDYNYPDIPRHYEEAIFVYMTEKGEEVDLYGRKISQNTIQRFQRFTYLANRYSNNMKEGINVLRREFGDSYFFYHFLYLLSGGAK